MDKIQKKDSKQTIRKKSEIGNRYVCGVCGLGIVIDENCCCDKACDLVCCGERMTLC